MCRFGSGPGAWRPPVCCGGVRAPARAHPSPGSAGTRRPRGTPCAADNGTDRRHLISCLRADVPGMVGEVGQRAVSGSGGCRPGHRGRPLGGGRRMWSEQACEKTKGNQPRSTAPIQSGMDSAECAQSGGPGCQGARRNRRGSAPRRPAADSSNPLFTALRPEAGRGWNASVLACRIAVRRGTARTPAGLALHAIRIPNALRETSATCVARPGNRRKRRGRADRCPRVGRQAHAPQQLRLDHPERAGCTDRVRRRLKTSQRCGHYSTCPPASQLLPPHYCRTACWP